jgi:hypothetical protein
MLFGLLDRFGFSDWALSCHGGLHVDSDSLVQEAVLKGGVLRVLGLRRCKRSCFAAWLGVAGDVTSHDDFAGDFSMSDECWLRDSLRVLFGVMLLVTSFGDLGSRNFIRELTFPRRGSKFRRDANHL